MQNRYIFRAELWRVLLLQAIVLMCISTVLAFKRKPVVVGFAGLIGAVAAVTALVDAASPDDRELRYELEDLKDAATRDFALANPMAYLSGDRPSSEFIAEYARRQRQTTQHALVHTPTFTPTPVQTSYQSRPSVFDNEPVETTVTVPSSLVQTDTSWMDKLINPSVLLVFGADGTGKTTFAFELIKRRLLAGHEVIVLDPHNEKGKWGDLTVKGAGMNHRELESFIAKLGQIVTQRYEESNLGISKQGEFPHVTVVVEEFTNYSAEVKNSADLLRNAGNYRKACIHLLMIAHGDKLGQLGAPKGFSSQLNELMCKVCLGGTVDASGTPIPSFKGWYQFRQSAKVDVDIPRLTTNADDLKLPKIPVQAEVKPYKVVLPKVRSNTYNGLRITEPHLQDVLHSHEYPYLSEIVHHCVRQGGEIRSSYLAETVAPITPDLQYPDGSTFTAETIRYCFQFFIEKYPRFFQQSTPKQLQIKPSALAWFEQEFTLKEINLADDASR